MPEQTSQTGSSCNPEDKKKALKPINLALQGGGAHGAYTWGVMDRLLEDGRLDIEAISATSAGAMNAVVFAYGASIGGHEGARAKLEEFWSAVSHAGSLYSPVQPSIFEKLFGVQNIDYSPTYQMFEMISRVFSPYQLNPLNFNPLKDLLEKIVDFEALQKCQHSTRLHLSATNVRTGKIRIFHSHEITSDVVMASACLPFMFQAIEIDGEYYWDGGYVGNPAIYPLIYRTQCDDVLIIHINPLEREKIPETAPDIYNRINEISFNSSLIQEMRAIAFVTKLIDKGVLEDQGYHRMRIHAINNDDVMTGLNVSSKLSPDWDFLTYLKDEGRKSATLWLNENFEMVGTDSSINIQDCYL